MDYAVVRFKKNDDYDERDEIEETSEVPILWLEENEDTEEWSCWWPPASNRSVQIAKARVPDKVKWTLYPVEIDAYAGKGD